LAWSATAAPALRVSVLEKLGEISSQAGQAVAAQLLGAGAGALHPDG
jgi:hypothetical protein